jgi:SH3 domain protein
MRFTILPALWLAATFAVPAAVHAETAYVTDNLRLGLHQAADTSDRAFRTLESGQTVEILSRDRNYAQVRLPDGEQGYLKAAYLVFEKPAKLIVTETQAENEKLSRELENTKRAFAAPAATIDSLESDVARNKAALDESLAKVQELSKENSRFRRRQSGYKYSMPFSWVAGALGLSLLVGILLGVWIVDYRSRKRHGGVRIY